VASADKDIPDWIRDHAKNEKIKEAQNVLSISSLIPRSRRNGTPESKKYVLDQLITTNHSSPLQRR
jgi:hypothetical protein